MPPPSCWRVSAPSWRTCRRGVIVRNLALDRANRFKHSRQRLISRYIDLWNRRSRRLGSRPPDGCWVVHALNFS